MKQEFDNVEKLVEIGFGYGEFLLHLSDKTIYPLFGVDIANFCFDKAMRKLRDKNVFLMKSDGYFFLKYMNAPYSIRDIYILFPDPWPQNPKRRLIDRDFAVILASRLTGSLYVVSDHKDYMDFIVDSLKDYFDFEPWEFRCSTKYLRKWMSLGKSFWSYRFIVRRREHVVYERALIELSGNYREIEVVRGSNFIIKKTHEYTSLNGRSKIVGYLYAEKNYSFTYYFLVTDGRIKNINTSYEVIPPALTLLLKD